MKRLTPWFVLAGTSLLLLAGQASAEEAIWRVGKSSGQVWLGNSAAQQVSLGADAALHAGETVRTGKNGRVLLTRGEETILVGPNSEMALPAEAKDGMSTTILQRAGSIVLEVEKKNAPHFEVVTPYLAAVVKGTQFRVSVDGKGGRVDVTRGQVEVADYKSGQYAVVLPGQAANVTARGIGGLSLSGAGSLNKIEHGQPRVPPVRLAPVPRGGFAGPAAKPDAADRRAGASRAGSLANTATSIRVDGRIDRASDHAGVRSATRISAPLGEVRMNFHAVTHGLARAASGPTPGKPDGGKDTVWGPSNPGGVGNAAAAQNTTGNGGPGAASSTGGGAGMLSASGGPAAVVSGAVTASKPGVGHATDENPSTPVHGVGPVNGPANPGNGPANKVNKGVGHK